MQEMAHAVWTQAGKLNRNCGFASIKEMIPAPQSNMPLRVQLKFFRTQAQRLRRTADVISSDLVSSQCAPQSGALVSTLAQCAPQIQTCAHFPQQNYCNLRVSPIRQPQTVTIFIHQHNRRNGRISKSRPLASMLGMGLALKHDQLTL